MNLTGLLACLSEDPGFVGVRDLARAGSGSTVEVTSSLHPLVVAQITAARDAPLPSSW